jgi:hypothetical protein
VIKLTIEFFEDCIKPKATWNLLKPNVESLIQHFIFPELCMTDDELEKFEEEPVDFVKENYGDYNPNYFNWPATAASSFITVLGSSRKAALLPILTFVNEIVAKSVDSCDGGGPPPHVKRRADQIGPVRNF